VEQRSSCPRYADEHCLKMIMPCSTLECEWLSRNATYRNLTFV
jgi:hypothetical protein